MSADHTTYLMKGVLRSATAVRCCTSNSTTCKHTSPQCNTPVRTRWRSCQLPMVQEHTAAFMPGLLPQPGTQRQIYRTPGVPEQLISTAQETRFLLPAGISTEQAVAVNAGAAPCLQSGTAGCLCRRRRWRPWALQAARRTSW